MKRNILLNVRENSANTLNISHTSQNQTDTTHIDQLQLERLLRKKRSGGYMEALRMLDSGGHVHNEGVVGEIIGKIKEEFPEIKIEDLLIGYIAKCNLGEPYEVHTLDISGSIIQHFKRGHRLPKGMEKARSMAMHGGYAFIEVYFDCCRAVGLDGSVSVIHN